MDPERDIGCLVLGRERQKLRREERAVVIVERTVEHEHALVEQLAPGFGPEHGDLAFFCHDLSLRGAAGTGIRFRPQPLRPRRIPSVERPGNAACWA
nr:hypothetical protein GCM10025699_02540 [Microbacterium flavescens]